MASFTVTTLSQVVAPGGRRSEFSGTTAPVILTWLDGRTTRTETLRPGYSYAVAPAASVSATVASGTSPLTVLSGSSIGDSASGIVVDGGTA